MSALTLHFSTMRFPRKRPRKPTDTESLALLEFEEDGAFLREAEATAADLVRRSSPDWKLIHIGHDEMRAIAQQFARVVEIATAYHRKIT